MSPSLRTRAIEAATSRIVAMLKFASKNEDFRVGIMELFDALAAPGDESVAQIRKFTAKLLQHYDEWPGPKTFRALWCQYAPPADGYPAELPGDSPAVLESQANYERHLEGHEERKRISGPALVEVRKLIAAPMVDPEFERQSKQWAALCKGYPVARVFRSLSMEFATADVKRRAEILATIRGRLEKGKAI